MRKNICITTIMILCIIFGNITSVIAAVADNDSLKIDHQLSVLVDDKKTTNKQIFVAVNDTSNQERELTMKIPDGLSFNEAATTNENKTNRTDISVDRSIGIIKIKFRALETTKSSGLVFSVVDEMKAQKSAFSVHSKYENITYTSEEVRIDLPKESSKEQKNQGPEKNSNQYSSEFSNKILAQQEPNQILKETSDNSRASSEYLPVPTDIVPMSGILTQNVGDSAVYDNDNNVLRITDNTYQLGGRWSKKQLDFTRDFTYDSYLYLGNRNRAAADGMTFTFQNDPRMATTPDKVISGDGFALGVYGDDKRPELGFVQNALSIEFDTYYNQMEPSYMDKNLDKNNSMGHVAIVIPSNNNNTPIGQHQNPQYPTDYLSNGTWRKFKVQWNAADKALTYSLDGLSTETYKFDPVKVFGSNKAYWGFTGSTGAGFATNAVAISEIPQKGSQLLKIKDERTQEVITDVGQVQPGDSLEYELDTKYIDGPENWANVFIKLSLPTGITYTPESITSDGKVISDSGNVSGQSLNVSIGDLKTDQVNKLLFKAKVNDNIADQTKLLNRGLAYNTDFGIQSNLVTLQVNKPKDPVLTKQVRNVTKGEEKFKDETSAYKDDKVEYETIVTLDANKDLSDGVFKDQVDNNLTVLNDEVQMQIEQPDGSWGPAQNIPIDTTTGEIKLTEKVKGTSKIRFTFEVTVNADSKSEIDNTFSLIGGSYNGPWNSNVAKIKVGKKTPPTLIKKVKNITKSDSKYASETVAEVGDEIEYQIQIVDTASDDIKPGSVLKDIFDTDLGDIQQVKIDYLDQNEKITATQTDDWTNNQVTLDHGIPVAGQGMAIAYVKAKVKETNKSVINNSASLATDFGTGTSEKAKLNIKQSKGRIVVRYRDRKDENHKLAEDKIYDGKIGDSEKIQPKVIPDSQGNWTVVDSSNQPNPDWGSTTKPDWELAHDYTVTYAKDEQVITYRYEESHIGIIADKRWDFGKYDTTGTDRNYYLKAKTKDNQKQPYAVGVEDYYTSKGWTLNVKQDDQFHTNANEKIAGDQKFLDNAVLNFHNGQIALKESDDVGATAPVSKLTSEFELIPKGEAVNLMTHTNKTPDPGYYAAHGFGIWEYQFGDSKKADYSIGLRVPQTTKRYPRQYTSQLTWSLVIAE